MHWSLLESPCFLQMHSFLLLVNNHMGCWQSQQMNWALPHVRWFRTSKTFSYEAKITRSRGCCEVKRCMMMPKSNRASIKCEIWQRMLPKLNGQGCRPKRTRSIEDAAKVVAKSQATNAMTIPNSNGPGRCQCTKTVQDYAKVNWLRPRPLPKANGRGCYQS